MTTELLTLTNTTSHAPVAPAFSVAPADVAAPLDTVTALLISIYGNMRKRAIQDAILAELVERNNNRIATGKPPVGKIGAMPRLPLPHLANSMANARAHGERAWKYGGGAVTNKG